MHNTENTDGELILFSIKKTGGRLGVVMSAAVSAIYFSTHSDLIAQPRNFSFPGNNFCFTWIKQIFFTGCKGKTN